MLTATNYRQAALKQLPVISPLAMQLIGKLTRFDVDLNDVGRTVEKDAILCGQILRAVNSARYARRGSVSRIRDALVLLGVSKLRNLALSLTVTNLFGRTKTAPGWSPLRFNIHSVAVAMLSEILASYVRTEHAESAFVAGLLHDVGKYAIALNLHAEHTLIHNMVTSSGRSIDECERDVLGFDHAELSGLMLARWEFPLYLQQGAYHHHAPEPSDPDQKLRLSELLHSADRFVNYLGITVHNTEPEELPSYELSVPGRDVPKAEILKAFEINYRELAELFS